MVGKQALFIWDEQSCRLREGGMGLSFAAIVELYVLPGSGKVGREGTEEQSMAMAMESHGMPKKRPTG